ncbi:MAG: hypothetical protein NVV74_14450 [Magnetospirillum sp.]|nr:hypothetical protein [Magnetospirillum sp.]
MNMAVPDQYFHLLEQGFEVLEKAPEEAMRRGLEARELAPERPEALYLLGVASWQLDRHMNALDLLQEGHRLAPDAQEYSAALAHLYSQLGKLADGLYHSKLTHTQHPDPFLSRQAPANLRSADHALMGAGYAAYFHHAQLAFDAQDYGRARELCESELALNPSNVECLRLYGQVLDALGLSLKAVAAFRACIAAGQDDAPLLVALARALCGAADFAAAIDAAGEAICRTPGDGDVLAGAIRALDALPSGMDQPRADLVAIWNRSVVAEPLPQENGRAPFPGRLLRIGYLINAAAAEGALDELEAVLSHHSAGRVEIYAYQLFSHSPAAIQRLRGKVPNWRELVDVDDLTAAYILAGDELDVLIDVCPMTVGARSGLLAARPAPLQVAWHGEVSNDVFDAVLGGPHVSAALPAQTRIIDLPNGPLCRPLTPFLQAVAQDMAPPALEHGTVTFGARLELAAISPSVANWARILHELPGATLLLGLVHSPDRLVADRLYELFATYGVADRVLFANEGGDPNVSFWARIDILLTGLRGPRVDDVATAVTMGVPVVVRAGGSLRHGRAAGVLEAIGQENWLAQDDDQYVKIALSMGRSADVAASLRDELLKVIGETPLCSGRAFTDQLEAALVQYYLLAQ